ncbi:Uncharacterised protein [Mycobacteroides abscessus subsp. massiliense]|nr:Uncharacterised protein [Mycobacteroides abscessus subsp. massiliense]
MVDVLIDAVRAVGHHVRHRLYGGIHEALIARGPKVVTVLGTPHECQRHTQRADEYHHQHRGRPQHTTCVAWPTRISNGGIRFRQGLGTAQRHTNGLGADLSRGSGGPRGAPPGGLRRTLFLFGHTGFGPNIRSAHVSASVPRSNAGAYTLG